MLKPLGHIPINDTPGQTVDEGGLAIGSILVHLEKHPWLFTQALREAKSGLGSQDSANREALRTADRRIH